MSDKSNKPLSTLTPLSQRAMEARKPLPVASLLEAQQGPIHPYDEPGRAASVARPNKPLSNLSSLTSLPHISAPIINLPLSADEAVLQWETDEVKEQSQARLDPSHVPSLLFSGWHTLGDLPLPPPPQNPQPPQDPKEPHHGPDVTPDDPYRGMHEIVRQMTPYAYANVTPASYREPRSQAEQPATPPQIDPGVVHGFKRESIHADFTTPITPINQGESNAMSMIEGSAYQEAQEDAKERLQEEKSQEGRTGQGSATEGGESDAAEALTEPSLPPYKTPHWIREDPDNSMAFWCDHPEVSGRFEAGKPTLQRDINVERAKGRAMGSDQITGVGAVMAEWLGCLSAGFVAIPDGFKPGDLVDDKLPEVLYMELTSRWDRFRSRFEPPAAI